MERTMHGVGGAQTPSTSPRMGITLHANQLVAAAGAGSTGVTPKQAHGKDKKRIEQNVKEQPLEVWIDDLYEKLDQRLSSLRKQLSTEGVRGKAQDEQLLILQSLKGLLNLEMQRLLEGLTPPHLTRQQRTILTLVSRQVGTEEIAERLYISKRTVYTHLSDAATRLGVAGREQSVQVALTWGLISDSDAIDGVAGEPQAARLQKKGDQEGSSKSRQTVGKKYTK